MNRNLFALLLALLAFQVASPAVHAKVKGGIEFSHDSDDADMYGFYAGYSHSLVNSRSRSEIGFRFGVLTLTDPIGTERFRVLELNHGSEPLQGARLDLTGKWLKGDWSPFLYSGNFNFRPGQRWYIEVFSERGIVDSVTSVQLEYSIDTLGISADYGLGDEFTLVGALFGQSVSDGNDRIGIAGRVVYTPTNHPWLNLQVKARTLDSEFDGVGYFSPERLTEYFFLVGAARPFAGDDWVIRGQTGPGIQVVDEHGSGTERKPAFLMELKLKGWFTQKFGLDGRLGYTNAQSTGGSDRYIYGEVNVVRTW